MRSDASALPPEAPPVVVLPGVAGGGAGLAAAQRRALRRALDLRELRHGELWLSFFALGGTAGPDASVALAAYRAARRRGEHLTGQAAAVDEVLRTHFPDALVTGVLLHADLETGRLTYLGAGHPPPLVLRDGRVVADLVDGRRTPFGLPPDHGPVPGEFPLQPGDWIVLHTDGVEEARDARGEFFGHARLVDFVERAVAADFGPAETVRRLVRAILEHQGGALQDDATVLVARWTGKDGGGS